MRDSGAAVVVTADGTTRRGKTMPLKQTLDEALNSGAAVDHVVVVRHLAHGVDMRKGRDVYWDELDPTPAPVGTAPTESNDPLTIVYTSGTTGKPKGIVHSHAGLLVKRPSTSATGSTSTPTTSSPGSPTWGGHWAHF
ncbi:AMP-binding protein [Rhodococcus sp. JS3073]|nr:AMP-binding protein [Rhodococcus sp. JS3073]WAM12343.1 AMP-binding protein [Rhodococcus sp. JS3073]